VSTGRCMRTLKFDLPVKDVAWNPNSSHSTVAAAVYDFIIFDFCASFNSYCCSVSCLVSFADMSAIYLHTG